MINVAALDTAINWRAYLCLCKLKVVSLIVFTALVGMLLATPNAVPLSTLFWGLLGVGLGAACGAAINHIVDQRIDALMTRTENRPLPQQQLTTAQALVFAGGLGVLSMFILGVMVNALTAWLTLVSMVGYAVVYTMYLKRSTPHNIVLGGAAGAAPPVLGWTAVTGELHTDALLLFLIIFIWTPPHFWPLAIKRLEDYRKAGVPMLPVTHGVAFTKLNIVLYTLMLIAVTLMPFLTHMSGVIYLIAASVLGAGFLYHAMVLYRSEGDQHAMKTFGYSIFYLSALFIALLVDHYVAGWL
ncbi:protoheme IX farnesyltransferase [Thiothrix caldifontis]|jgi:protoheme IX farnesyltransferase|uniref:Protoheme IX farnesyltransferase n=1 Tax=Thiothrix caldifontis TaxID=525918 RepID=A0A1H4GGB9_9GAMM|nr:heme o synthase [Thiothrix caldifontis]SEB08060.1 protoheme IX farnesyltransferase [Thiothrix caldifontis]